MFNDTSTDSRNDPLQGSADAKPGGIIVPALILLTLVLALAFAVALIAAP